jgi:hypothetical protein
MESKQNMKPTKGLMMMILMGMMMITITQKTLTTSFFFQMRDESVIENNFCSLSVFLLSVCGIYSWISVHHYIY